MWRNRNIWILMIGQFIAETGIWFGLIGNLEFLQQNLSSSFLQSLILLAGFIVGALITPLTGRIIDKCEKKKILIYCSIIRIVAVIFMFIAIEINSVWWMIGYTILIGFSNVFYLPTLQTLIPLLVRGSQLVQTNGILMNVIASARIAGAGLAGFLLAKISLFSLYLYALIAYIFLVIFIFKLDIDQNTSNEESNQEKNNKQGFKEVFTIIKTKPTVFSILLLTLVPYFFLSGFNLMVITLGELHSDSSFKGLIYSVEGLCSIIGAYIIKYFSKGRNFVPLLLIAALFIALSHVSLFLAEIKWSIFVSFGLFGLALGSYFTLSTTFFQKEVPNGFHGRFFSFKMMMETTMFLVLMMTTGLFLDTIGFKKMVLLFGTTSILLVSTVSMCYIKTQSNVTNLFGSSIKK
jgi:DHA3 family macrolide efflux protein-like MFS transporter